MTVEIRVLRRDDDRQGFRSGDALLDVFFHRYAGQNQFRHHIGVSYVAVDGSEILGFVTVAPAALDADDLPTGRRMPPYPMPVLRLARLAVDERHGGRGVGQSLLRFAIELAERMREELGCVGIVVDAKPNAVSFYDRFGFEPIHTEVGASHVKPAPVLMFLALEAIPQRR